VAKKLQKELRKAVSSSGYLFEQRLAAFLKTEGYYVIPNYSFKDPETGDHREIDVWAYGATQVTRKRREFIFPMLLIEAKNLPPLLCSSVNLKFQLANSWEMYIYPACPKRLSKAVDERT